MPSEVPDYPVPHQQVVHHYHGNGNSRESKLNAIILGVAAFGMTFLIGIGLWQVQRLIEKVDNLNDRIVRVEVKLGTQPPP